MTSALIIQGAKTPLVGSVPLPVDEEILAPRLALAALARGKTTCRATGLQDRSGVLLAALSRLGVRSDVSGEAVVVEGVGLMGFSAPDRALDLRGTPSVAGLVLGLCVSQPFFVELWVDSIVAELLVPPLSEAHSLQTAELPPGEGAGVRVLCSPAHERASVCGLSVVVHGVFPWVKQALLLAGIRASTPSQIEEKVASADHLERALLRSRLPFQGEGTIAQIHPPRDEDAIAPQTYEHLGSGSLLAPIVAAAALIEGSRVVLRDVTQNPTRGDFLLLARLLGATCAVQPTGDRQGEPLGNIEIAASGLRARSLGGESVLRARDTALFCLPLMALCSGTSQLQDLALEERGGDRRILGRAAGLLRSAGARVEVDEAGLVVEGTSGARLRPLRVTTGGDARLALLASILALAASGESVIDDVDCLRRHFPRWVGTLRALSASIEVKTA